MSGLTRPLTRGLTRNPTSPPRRRLPPVFYPTSLFKPGDLGVFVDPADELSLFADYAGTTTLIQDEGGVIANAKDLSGNNVAVTRLSTTLRPQLTLLLGSYRRGVDYDGVDDALNIALPDMGSNCTIVRARPGIGAAIATGQTISGALNESTDHCGLVAINRPLTDKETTDLTLWCRRAAGVEDEYNLVYGADATNERLDVFHSTSHPARPIILIVHGGGWRNGSKASPNVTKNKLQHWLARGFTFVSVEYNLAVGTDPIDQARSVAKAAAWVQGQARGWGCKASNLILMGHSAGGHLVALVSADKSIRDEAGMGDWAGTVVLDGAAYDVQAIMERVGHLSLYDEPWGTDPAHWVAGSPTFQLTVAPPPMLLVTSTSSNPGEADENVGPFADAVNALGGSATILHTNFDHSGTNAELGRLSPYTAAVDDFIARLGLEAPFDVADVHAQASNSFELDLQDLSTVFQDSAGTTPAVVGQPVGLVLDASGRGHHALQATAGARPTLAVDINGKYYLQWASGKFLIIPSLDLTGTDKLVLVAGLQKDSDAVANQVICELGTNSSTVAGSFRLVAPQSGANYGSVFGGTLHPALNTAASYAAPHKAVVTLLGDIAADNQVLRVNGTEALVGAVDMGTGNLGSLPLYIGSRAGSSFFFTGRLYSLKGFGLKGNLRDVTNLEHTTAQDMALTL